MARLCYEAGADMGNPDQFYRPDKWNPDGYFEQPDIHAVNMPLINGMWWKFAYFWLPSTSTILKRAQKMADQIRQTASRYQGKVVKETRFCLTLPAWLKYGTQVSAILVCLRDPIQVARSLQKRNYITRAYALKLWYLHNMRLLENAAGIPLWFVYYNNLLHERLFLPEMHGALQMIGYDGSDEELQRLRSTCVKPQMNHHPERREKYPREIALLWSDLLERHQKQYTTPA
ncbi:hypothetical protein GF339_09300 [candidate division KSB3 bacterium]|uniref:Sulfotransferase family protein n=1 Tax=candidate division KSB3 bacterium TaxID=2044937 RepID=A0A9D5JVA0_9BACT|nr:hypothetical protein [candidate division KSB3 bacterium]MBD3324769.1 hypothetical protein [candidate division KSB3 bacterium]